MNPRSVESLRDYNDWRRGSGRHDTDVHGFDGVPDMPNPQELGEAIDWACEQIERMQCRPIETAPRDSRRVLVASNHGSAGWIVREAWWRLPYDGAPDNRCWWCYDGDRTLLDSSVHNGLGATHWMPLPPPPGETK